MRPALIYIGGFVLFALMQGLYERGEVWLEIVRFVPILAVFLFWLYTVVRKK